MAAYTKSFLVSAFLSRYYGLPTDKFTELETMATSFFDEVGRDRFRVYCSLDANAIREYKDNYEL
jgi:hypothetical protein